MRKNNKALLNNGDQFRLGFESPFQDGLAVPAPEEMSNYQPQKLAHHSQNAKPSAISQFGNDERIEQTLDWDVVERVSEVHWPLDSQDVGFGLDSENGAGHDAMKINMALRPEVVDQLERQGFFNEYKNAANSRVVADHNIFNLNDLCCDDDNNHNQSNDTLKTMDSSYIGNFIDIQAPAVVYLNIPIRDDVNFLSQSGKENNLFDAHPVDKVINASTIFHTIHHTSQTGNSFLIDRATRLKSDGNSNGSHPANQSVIFKRVINPSLFFSDNHQSLVNGDHHYNSPTADLS